MAVSVPGAAGAAAPQQRIVGGAPAPAGSWPSIAGVMVGGGSSLCGGTVIASQWVVTAAHCVVDSLAPYDTLPASEFMVITGRRDLDDQSTGQELSVQQVLVHPQYERGNTQGRWDAALLHLSAPTSAPAMPIATPSGVSAGAYFSPVPARPDAAGWGAQYSGSTDPAPPLQEIALPLLSDGECSGVDAAYDPGSMVCAGTPGKDTCQGDSGGPLTISTHLNGVETPVLWGITSWGNGCGESAGFYVRVTALGDFLAPAGPQTAWGLQAPPPPPPAPPAPPSAPPTAPTPLIQPDVTAPSLSNLVVPRVSLAGTRARRSIVLRLRSTERATLEVALQRQGARRRTGRVFRVPLVAGPNRVTVPRRTWRLARGRYVLVLRVVDAAGNASTTKRAIRVR
jgi:hypothetical protein